MSSAVRPAGPGELPAVAALIGLAFDHLDQNRALVPDATDRLRVMTDFFALVTASAPAAGAVDVISGPEGAPAAAAVWFDRTGEPDPVPSYDERLAVVAGRHLPAFLDLERVLGAHHPPDPHWHLAFLAVHPDHRRAGLGTALLQHRHARLTGPAYLEATNADNIRLYRRHGYHSMIPFKICLRDGTPFYRLWRAYPPVRRGGRNGPQMI
ncbi:N-acetyltransferase [Actinoplanes sp. N902-109]|uniref:GNAT family N-acetyltransferase n=1 Tax=Actinoplanes sp. (strain N902-109) TaxID=649831 RepID=UPI0003293B6F|nr:GNAT family N-acetyltransferase [Actinoplanes sp. N902-109]AGL18279.1 GCN5-like N-acetyltransferase [Actinoplanes sp. N902-109]